MGILICYARCQTSKESNVFFVTLVWSPSLRRSEKVYLYTYMVIGFMQYKLHFAFQQFYLKIFATILLTSLAPYMYEIMIFVNVNCCIMSTLVQYFK